MKPAAIAAGVVALGLVAWGGFALKHELTCRGLEEDYVNEASDLRGTVAMRAVGGRETQKSVDTLQKLDLEQMKATLGVLYEKCGARAGATAARKASDVLLGS